jgi:hypothetical protein
MGGHDPPPHRLAAICQKGGAAGQDRSELSDGTKPDKALGVRQGNRTVYCIRRNPSWECAPFFCDLTPSLGWNVKSLVDGIVAIGGQSRPNC